MFDPVKMNPPPARRLGISFPNPTAICRWGRLLTPHLWSTSGGPAPHSNVKRQRLRLDAVVISNRIIEYTFYFLFFLTPLVMTPFNYELFEFNKMMLVYLLTTLIITAWLVKMIIAKKFIFKRTFWNLPLIIFFLSQFFSFLISIDRHTSFWGYYSRFHGGLLSTIAFVFLFWAFVSNFSEIKPKKPLINKKIVANNFVNNCLLVILASAFLVAVYGIAEHFGIDADYWVQDVQNRVFSSLGQPNWLAAYLVALTPLSWTLILNLQNQKDKMEKGWLFLAPHLLFLTLYLALLYTKSRSGLLGFMSTYLAFWGLVFFPVIRFKKKAIKTLKPQIRSFFIITSLLFLASLLVGTPWTPNLENLFSKTVPVPSALPAEQPSLHISESGEIRKIVWQGAINIWKNHPVLGTGPETFAYSYYWYRPREHNDISEWDFLYNKAHNEYLNYAATTGTIGLLAYLGLIISFIFWGLRNLNRPLFPALVSGFIGIIVTNFFGFSVVVVSLFFYLFPALAFSPASKEKTGQKAARQKSLKLNFSQTLGIVLVVFAFLASTFSLAKIWYVDFIFAKGEKLNQAGNHKKALMFLQQAVHLRPSEPLYHNTLSISAAHLAVAAHEQDQESDLSEELARIAIAESDRAIAISPFHLNYWKNRTRVFYALADIEEKYNQEALKTLQQAAQISPTDAKIFYNLGLLYAAIGQEDEAIKTLEKTVQLKPNYTDARYALALFYEQRKETEKAKEQLEYILEKINPLHDTAREKLEKL